MPQNRAVKLFPSEKNYQKSNEVSVPLQWAITYLQSITKPLSNAEVLTARLQGWNNISVEYETEISDDQLRKEKLEKVRQVLSGCVIDGASPEKVKELIEMLY